MSQSFDSISSEFMNSFGESSSQAVGAYLGAQNTIKSSLNNSNNMVSNANALSNGTNAEIAKTVLQREFGLTSSASQSSYKESIDALSHLVAIKWNSIIANSSVRNSTLGMRSISKSPDSADLTSNVPEKYVIIFKRHTPFNEVEDYLARLPYHGYDPVDISEEYTFDYLIMLTQAEADERENDSIVDAIDSTRPTSRAIPLRADSVKFSRRADFQGFDEDLWVRAPSTTALNLLSRDPSNPLSQSFESYLFHPSLGSGVTVYVIDDGINFNHEEFKDRGTGVSSTGWCVPNSRTDGRTNMPDRGPDALKEYTDWSETEQHYLGHGTSVASVAVGKNFGVASKANLIMVKMFNGISTGKPLPGAPATVVTPSYAAWRWATNKIFVDIIERRLERKAVVNLSYAIEEAGESDGKLRNLLGRFLRICAANKIVVVVGSGNFGNQWRGGPSDALIKQKPDFPATPWNQDFEIPGNLATAYPSLIVVGGINRNGSLFFRTTPVTSPGREPISVYALASGVKVALPFTDTASRRDSGCSFSAGIISGLVAYTLGLPDSMTNLANSQNFVRDVKSLIQSNAWQRVPLEKQLNFPADHLNYGNSMPSSFKAAYNGAWQDICSGSESRLLKVKRNNQTIFSGSGDATTGNYTFSDDAISENNTSKLSDPTASDRPVFVDGGVHPDYESLFAVCFASKKFYANCADHNCLGCMSFYESKQQ